MIVDAKALFEMLRGGGSIVSSNDCSEYEIAMANACHRFYVDEQNFGYVYRPASIKPDAHLAKGTRIA